jgi:hypothetical protein
MAGMLRGAATAKIMATLLAVELPDGPDAGYLAIGDRDPRTRTRSIKVNVGKA